MYLAIRLRWLIMGELYPRIYARTSHSLDTDCGKDGGLDEALSGDAEGTGLDWVESLKGRMTEQRVEADWLKEGC